MAHYALYNYYTNRSRPTASTEEGGSVADFLSNEARSNNDFSLEVVHTSLTVEQEQDLRMEIVMRLSTGCVYSGSGDLIQLKGPSTTVPAGVPLPVMLCYFHVVRDEAAAEAATKVEQDDDQGEDDQGNEQDSGDQQQSYFSSDHVLCLLRQFASQDVELDLFRPELDAYCTLLARNGVLKACRDRASIERPRGQPDPTAALADWYRRTIEYLPRCVHFFGDRLHLVIQAALVSQKVDVVGGKDELRRDIQSFFAALSLSALVHQPAEMSAEGGLHHEYLMAYEDAVIDINAQGTDFQLLGHIGDSCKLCRSWARAMLAANTDVMRLKRVINSHGLQVIQEINTMKGLLNQAEANHYALYNAHQFLGTCRTPTRAILNSVCRSVWPASARQSAKDVVLVLLDFEQNYAGNVPTSTEAEAEC